MKCLGEISAGEFRDFIGENIRLAPINLHHTYSTDELLSFFMGIRAAPAAVMVVHRTRPCYRWRAG